MMATRGKAAVTDEKSHRDGGMKHQPKPRRKAGRAPADGEKE
jgi:hypothetical protein